MWVARDKNGVLCLYNAQPTRLEECFSVNPNNNPEIDCQLIGDYICLDPDLFPNIKWEDEPIEVEVVSINELLSQQNELKDVYHELIEYQTSKIYNLTRVYRGVQLEEVGNIIKDTEEKIHDKYKMIGNPNCSQNCRAVTIPHSSVQLGDNSLREYVADDKVVATIYVRRNDFNNADILVSDLGNEYCTTK